MGNGLGGSIGSFSALGGTNSLVSVDALQEFRIQTSTYAPEFGRTPGGQISIVTRAGTNQFHGTAFEYLRNDLFDANDWFADQKGLGKPEERQNDFGGTFSGPVLKDRTFFFFSYEGFRLRLPQVAKTTVPDLSARQVAVPAVQQFLNAYPLPTPGTPDDAANGIGQFNASYSNPATLDAFSLRMDHHFNSKVTVFGRYNNAPSKFDLRGGNGTEPLSNVNPFRITTQTATAGVTWSMSPAMSDDFRFNYSRANGSNSAILDQFGGAIPPAALPFPAGFTTGNAHLVFDIFSLAGSLLEIGHGSRNLQRQMNVVDTFSDQKGPHSLKFGVDFRSLSPLYDPGSYGQAAFFLDVSSAGAGNPFVTEVSASRQVNFLFRNLGAFAQDTWRAIPRLTVTYGLRWDVDFAPSTESGPNFLAVTGYNLNNLAALALAPPGTSPFETRYDNIAPRFGLAYQVTGSQDWETVVRGGFGVFFDLATSEAGNFISPSFYPFGAFSLGFGGTFPLSPTAAEPPAITAANLSLPFATLFAFDPHLKLPYSLQWNVALQQALGRQQSLSASYIGSAGRRLLQSADIVQPNPSFGNADLVGNTATSDYDALQLQFQRRLLQGLQVLASYTWAHSIDTASAGSFANLGNTFVPGLNPNANRGPSDFDIRSALSAAATYDIPTRKMNAIAGAMLHGWSVQNIIQARSAAPVNIYYSAFGALLNSATQVRPGVLAGAPLYLFGSQFPGGKALNPGAFIPPPVDSNGVPTRQGNFGRNTARGFGMTQWDLAAHREFPIREPLKLQFRAELFNVLNHPNFGPPIGDLGAPQSLNPQFGQAIKMLGQSLGGSNVGGGGFDPLYQIGGPRSVQFALKLSF